MSRFRWVILGLLFFGTTVNYIDRLVMGQLATDLQKTYSIDNIHYGYIQGAFALAYALGQLAAGPWLDKVGTRIGYSIALVGWSISAMLHAFARGAWGFGICRVLLGISESPAYPAAAKTVAEWFPRRERAFAFGFVNAGSNMGVIIAPLAVMAIAPFGWQTTFVVTGAIGFFCLVVWLIFYRRPHEHPRVSPAELALINSDPPESTHKIPWLELMSYPQAWAFAVAKFLTDSMWWFYMTWFPKFLNDTYHINVIKFGLPLVAIYVMADIGSITGGWLSSSMIKRGATVNRARKTAMLVYAFGVVPIMFAAQANTIWLAVLVLGLATAAHQGFSSNIYTIVSDMFPKRAVASVAGFGGTFGYFGAFLFQLVVGHLVVDNTGYTIPFIIAGTAYLIAVGCIHLLAPRIAPIAIGEPPESGVVAA